MNGPCIVGFSCPYLSWDDDCVVCIYPKSAKDLGEEEVCECRDVMDFECPLVEEDSDLDTMMTAWSVDSGLSVMSCLQPIFDKIESEVEEFMERFRRAREGKK